MSAVVVRRVRWQPLALVPVALAAWVYHPVTRVFFWADDFFHLGRLTGDGALPWLLTPFGGHNLLLRNLAFLGSWHAFGFHPAAWYWTALLTHLVNVWLLFRILHTVTGSAGLASVGATMWGIGPLAGGTIGWYAVFGQAMAATILLAVLDQLARVAVTGERVSLRRAGLWCGLLLAGTTCFGTGIGVALAFPAVLFAIVPGAWGDARIRAAYLALPVVTVALYLGLRALAGWLDPLPEAERLQQSMAWTGLRIAPAMVLPLVAVAIGGSVLGHAFHTDASPDASAMAAVMVFLCGVAAVLARGSGSERRWVLAMLALTLGVYGVLAAGRAFVYAIFSVPLARGGHPRGHRVLPGPTGCGSRRATRNLATRAARRAGAGIAGSGVRDLDVSHRGTRGRSGLRVPGHAESGGGHRSGPSGGDGLHRKRHHRSGDRRRADGGLPRPRRLVSSAAGERRAAQPAGPVRGA
jgi:hypothetical protein